MIGWFSMSAVTELHITIASTPDVGGDSTRILEHDIRLVKSAALYADRITLCSLATWMCVNIAAIGELPLSHLQKAEFIASLAPSVALSQPQFADVAAKMQPMIRLLARKKLALTRRERLQRGQFKKLIDEAWPQLQASFAEIGHNLGLDELNDAYKSGILQVHPFTTSQGNEPVVEFVEALTRLLSETSTYPLLDESTARLVQAGVREGTMNVAHSVGRRLKHASLAGALIERLPLFDAAMEEVLAIRRALERPLTRFRGAIQILSESIQSPSWEEGFQSEVEAAYRKVIAPALADLEEEIQSNRYLTALLNKLMSPGVGPIAALAFGVASTAPTDVIRDLVVGIGLPVAAAAALRQGHNEWRAKGEQHTRNQYYFYYQAQHRLLKSKP
jgi:hypothetical protein